MLYVQYGINARTISNPSGCNVLPGKSTTIIGQPVALFVQDVSKGEKYRYEGLTVGS
jgi:hypothetical protein